MKTYKLATTDVADEQKTISISEQVTNTKEDKVTIAQLRERHASKLEQIERIKAEADKITDQLQEINDNKDLALKVKDIPSKLLRK